MSKKMNRWACNDMTHRSVEIMGYFEVLGLGVN